MPDGRGARIALEAGFLVVVAAVLAVAAVEPVWIVAVMLVAWVVVALLEWVAWREEPHWASGSPPRYYVPQQPLPPRPPTRELPAFTSYPRQRDGDAPTWIAPPELREELLGWPAALPGDEEPGDESPGDGGAASVEELPQELLAEVASAAAEHDEPEDVGWPVYHEPEHAEDAWGMEEQAGPESGPVPQPAPVLPPAVEQPSAAPQPAAPAAEPRLARHRIDPFAEPAARRLPWRRRAAEATPSVELPVLPRHVGLPARSAPERV